MSTIASRRAGALTGIVAIVLAFAGDAIATAGGSTDVHSSDAAILAALSGSHGAAWHLGVGMSLLGFAGLMVFAAYLASLVREESWLAGAILGSGVLFAAVKLGSVAPVWEAYWRAPDIDAGTARTLMDLGDFAFPPAWLGCSAALARRHERRARTTREGAPWAPSQQPDYSADSSGGGSTGGVSSAPPSSTPPRCRRRLSLRPPTPTGVGRRARA